MRQQYSDDEEISSRLQSFAKRDFGSKAGSRKLTSYTRNVQPDLSPDFRNEFEIGLHMDGLQLRDPGRFDSSREAADNSGREAFRRDNQSKFTDVGKAPEQSNGRKLFEANAFSRESARDSIGLRGSLQLRRGSINDVDDLSLSGTPRLNADTPSTVGSSFKLRRATADRDSLKSRFDVLHGEKQRTENVKGVSVARYELGTPLSLTIFADFMFVRTGGMTGRPSRAETGNSGQRMSARSPAGTPSRDIGEVLVRSAVAPASVQPDASIKATPEQDTVNWGFSLDGWEPNQGAMISEGWAGMILKKPAAGGFGWSSQISVGWPTSVSELALTAKQWAYAVAIRRGDFHVCAINLGGAFWAAVTHLKANSKRIRQESKISGHYPSCRVAMEFPPESHIRWLCTGFHRPSPDSASRLEQRETMNRRPSAATSIFRPSNSSTPKSEQKFSMRLLKLPPEPGFIRQDISFNITPFRSAWSEATGLKGGFVSINKFAYGFYRHMLRQQEDKIQLVDECQAMGHEMEWKARLIVNDYNFEELHKGSSSLDSISALDLDSAPQIYIKAIKPQLLNLPRIRTVEEALFKLSRDLSNNFANE